MNVIKFVGTKYNFEGPHRGLESASGKEYLACMEFLTTRTNRDCVRDPEMSGFIEIGSASGASFHLWASIIPGIKISVDMVSPLGLTTEDATDRREAVWKSYFSGVHSILHNSHKESTVEAVDNILKGEQVGWLYIDGDHSYEGVTKDFEMYSRFVSPGGYIGFHDVLAIHEPAVGKFWEELSGRYKGLVKLFEPLPGIGVIQV